MQWLADCHPLLTDPGIAFHKNHMEVMDTEESFVPGPCIIGSETINVYQTRSLNTWQDAVACKQDFIQWNKRAKDDLMVHLLNFFTDAEISLVYELQPFAHIICIS